MQTSILQLATPPVRSAYTNIQSKVDQYLTEFRIPRDEPVVVGLSGGKDSILATLVLRDLGIDIKPAIIDLGYDNFEADAIRNYVATLGVTAAIIRGARGPIYELMPLTIRRKHEADLAFLDNPGGQTPCGACSMSKRRLLQGYAEKVGAKFIVLAHHRTDAIVTILKDYFLTEYQKKWPEFDRERFKEFVANEPFALDKLRAMVKSQQAGTMGFRVRVPDSAVEVIRPLIFVDEERIAYVLSEAGIRTFGSGCSHSFFLTKDDSRATKRELVHGAVIQRFSEYPNLMTEIFDVARQSVNEAGYQRFNPRQARGQS